jgi:hypothetical protein
VRELNGACRRGGSTLHRFAGLGVLGASLGICGLLTSDSLNRESSGCGVDGAIPAEWAEDGIAVTSGASSARVSLAAKQLRNTFVERLESLGPACELCECAPA